MVVLIINNSSKEKIKKRTKKLIKIVEKYGFSTIVLSSNIELNKLLLNDKSKIKGIILSGGPLQLSDKICANDISQNINVLLNFPNIPILGICFGMQVMALAYGGKIDNLKKNYKKLLVLHIMNKNLFYLMVLIQNLIHMNTILII